MMKLRLGYVLLLWLCLSSFRLADGFQEQFRKAMVSGQAATVEKVLTAWEKATPRDPELYIAKFNWLLKKGERLELKHSTPTKEEALIIKDKQGKTVGNMGTGYDPAFVEKAAAALNKGIAIAPDRLDMYLGLIKTYEETGQPKLQLAVFTAALQAHARSGKPWRWSNGAPLPAPEAELVPSTLEAYAGFYWRQEDPDMLKWGRALAELLEQYYPKSSLGYFNLGVYYSMTNQAAKAYPKFQQADAIQPQDVYTLQNLTRLAIELKRKPEATAYMERLRQMPEGRESAEDFAKDLLKL